MNKPPIDPCGVCYVLVQINKVHPISEFRHDIVWYPERTMTLLDTVQYKPYVTSIVTESAWLIACYSKENVRVWDEKRGWIPPSRQTYGASVNHITMSLLGIHQTIPSCVLDGGTSIDKLRQQLSDERP